MNLSEKFACNRVVALFVSLALLISGVLVTGALGATPAQAMGGGSSAITINDGDDTFIAGGGDGVNGSVQPDPALGGAGGKFGVLGGSN